MLTLLAPFLLAPAAASPAATRFVQVAPFLREVAPGVRSPGQGRAVLLLHGFVPHPISKDNVARAALRDWQQPQSVLVSRLARDSDVYAFAYAQDVAPAVIAESPDLAAAIRRLRDLGYSSVVLVGHSAGGLIARQFVEDHPGAGVTKVIQVCAPNGGSSWALLQAVRGNQVEFLSSLTKSRRRETLSRRGNKLIPAHVEFVCVVGTGGGGGDGFVSRGSQWTADLQEQGIPAWGINATHFFALRGKKGADLVADLVKQPQPRWDQGRVAAVRHGLLGE